MFKVLFHYHLVHGVSLGESLVILIVVKVHHIAEVHRHLTGRVLIEVKVRIIVIEIELIQNVGLTLIHNVLTFVQKSWHAHHLM